MPQAPRWAEVNQAPGPGALPALPGRCVLMLTLKIGNGWITVTQRKILMVCIALCVFVGGASALPEDSWLADITVTSGTFVQVVTFGTDENGSDGYDRGLDLPAPPPPPNPVVDVYFAVEDSLFDRLYGDIRYILNATDPERIWTLQVLSKSEDALLAWDPAALPADIIFTLSAAGSEYDMKKVAPVSLTKGTGYAPVTIRARYSPAVSPVANFTADVTTGPAPLAVQFIDTSAGAPTGWFWDFGDGATSAEQNPVHTYTAPGTYTVNLTATNAGGSSTATKSDYIRVVTPPPVADFTANVTAGLAPLVVQFTDVSAGNPTAWLWSFGDNTTSTEQHPIHTYTALGNYTVNLTASTASGSATLSRPGYITVTVKGDFTGDGVVDIGDVAKVAYMVVKKVVADPAADFNRNGKVDIGDAAKIAYYFAGKIRAL